MTHFHFDFIYNLLNFIFFPGDQGMGPGRSHDEEGRAGRVRHQVRVRVRRQRLAAQDPRRSDAEVRGELWFFGL